jgi:hypothetical protein
MKEVASYWVPGTSMYGFKKGMYEELIRLHPRGDGKEIRYKFSITSV